MSEEQHRRTPPLFWYVNEQNNTPLIMSVSAGKVFPFFTTEMAAARHKGDLGGGWRLVSSSSADKLIELCEEVNSKGDYVFAVDPPATAGSSFKPYTADEMKAIIERNVENKPNE